MEDFNNHLVIIFTIIIIIGGTIINFYIKGNKEYIRELEDNFDLLKYKSKKEIEEKNIELDSIKDEINSLKRQINKTNITEKELIYKINNTINIKINECHINSLLIHQKFGAKIIIGQASYLEDGNIKITTNHLWNEYKANINEPIQLYNQLLYYLQ